MGTTQMSFKSTREFCFDQHLGPCLYGSGNYDATDLADYDHACSEDKGHTGQHYCECGRTWKDGQ